MMTSVLYYPRMQPTALRLMLAVALALAISMLSIGPAVHAAPAFVECDPLTEDCPPINDELPNAKEIILSPDYNDVLDVFDASGDPTDPQFMIGVGDCDSDVGNRSVWYKYTNTTSEIKFLYATTLNSGYDTLIGVWSPNATNLSNLVACNDTDPRKPWENGYPQSWDTSALVFPALAGQTYYFEVIQFTGFAPIQGTEVTAQGTGATLNFHVETVSSTYATYATTTFTSNRTYDGYALEKSEKSNTGGSKNNRSSALNVGDDYLNRQYRGFLHFDTSGLHDTYITSAQLQVKRAGVVGTLPFNSHRGLYTDIRSPYFGSLVTLQTSDFQASASMLYASKFPNKLYSGWYKANLYSSALYYINKTGSTQFRLRFKKDDNNDYDADYLKLYSGNAAVLNRPKLVVNYYYLDLPPLPPP